MSSSLIKSKFHYFGTLPILINILLKYKNTLDDNIQICENNCLLEFNILTNNYSKETYENHIDEIISNIKKITNINRKIISIKKNSSNMYIY